MKNFDEPMGKQWVIGAWVGDRAKSVIDHANAGLGYFILDQAKSNGQTTVKAAFQRAMDSPVPEHLTKVTDPFMLKKLDGLYNQRHNIQTT